MRRAMAWMAAGAALLAGCDESGAPIAASGVSVPSSGQVEYMVLKGRMSFDDCKARGGLIITDPGTSMVACDPTVRRPTVIEQENT